MLRKEAHSAQRNMAADAAALRRECAPSAHFFIFWGAAFAGSKNAPFSCLIIKRIFGFLGRSVDARIFHERGMDYVLYSGK